MPGNLIKPFKDPSANSPFLSLCFCCNNVSSSRPCSGPGSAALPSTASRAAGRAPAVPSSVSQALWADRRREPSVKQQRLHGRLFHFSTTELPSRVQPLLLNLHLSNVSVVFSQRFSHLCFSEDQMSLSSFLEVVNYFKSMVISAAEKSFGNIFLMQID